MRFSRSMLISGFLLLAASACKTSGSSTKDLPLGSINQMSLQQWNEACEKELANPAMREKALKDLQQLAGSTDCAAAYPVLKKIYAVYRVPQ